MEFFTLKTRGKKKTCNFLPLGFFKLVSSVTWIQLDIIFPREISKAFQSYYAYTLCISHPKLVPLPIFSTSGHGSILPATQTRNMALSPPLYPRNSYSLSITKHHYFLSLGCYFTSTCLVPCAFMTLDILHHLAKFQIPYIPPKLYHHCRYSFYTSIPLH